MAFQLLANVFHHVLALDLAMNEHIQIERLLLSHVASDLSTNIRLCEGRELRLPKDGQYVQVTSRDQRLATACGP